MADLCDDVDAFIQAKESGRIDDYAILEIASRLNKAFRPKEAIQWLNKIDDESHYEHQKIDQLVEAYRLEGLDKKAQSILWHYFEKTLSVFTYQDYLKHASATEKNAAKKKALSLCQSHQPLSMAIEFLSEAHEFELINQLLLARYDEVSGSDYYLYRGLSTKLAKAGFYLSATLLRRAVLTTILDQARSKSYKYAASDYKLGNEFAAKVTNWGKFETQTTFLTKIKATHARKKAFWSRVNEKGLD